MKLVKYAIFAMILLPFVAAAGLVLAVFGRTVPGDVGEFDAGHDGAGDQRLS